MGDTLRDDIITSRCADKMLRSVTPMYNDSYVGLWMYEAMGREYDEMFEIQATLGKQFSPETATWMIELWETRYGLPIVETDPIELRRARVIEMRQRSHPFTPQVLIDYIYRLTGRTATVDEHIGDYTFGVYVENDGQGVSPADMATLVDYINRHKHSHMSYDLYWQTTGKIKVKTKAEHYLYYYKATCGTLPYTNIIGIPTEADIIIDTEGTGYQTETILAGQKKAGTKPYTAIIGVIDREDVAVETAGDENIAILVMAGTADTGTEPGVSTQGGTDEPFAEAQIEGMGTVYMSRMSGSDLCGGGGL